MNIERPESDQTIPEGAEKVFKGDLFEVYRWEQEMYDGTKVVFEKVKRPDTVIVFPVLPDGGILLIEEEQPGKEVSLRAPGGRVEEGEGVRATAERELSEETGFEAGEFILWDAYHPASKLDWVIYSFVARELRKTKEPSPDKGERITPKVVTFEQFLEIGATGKVFNDRVSFKLLEAKHDPEKGAELQRLFDPTG